jgi:hypothetical protein
MNWKVVTVILLAFFAVLAGTAMADELNGIQLYPGAKHDPEASKFFSETLKVNGAAYRTEDPIVKVIDFYKGQKDLKAVHVADESAMFKKERIELTVQSPWKDMKTGKQMKDTLISIVVTK